MIVAAVTNTVEITAPCPQCGADATWHGTRVPGEGANGTAYDIDCQRCDRTWSLAHQIARRIERLTNPVLERTAA